MEIYFTDKVFRTYKITRIEYNDENFEYYEQTKVYIERNDLERAYCFNGILSLTDIIRELSKKELGMDIE